MQERKALGKGLSSLIPLGNRAPEQVNKNYFECLLADLVPSQNQPRKLFDKASLDELAASIEEKGILQPLIVRTLGGGKYEIVAGERRFRAAQSLHLEKIPVIVKEVDDQETLELALIENLQREDLNPVEEALAYKELLGKYQYTQEELAKRIGKDRSSIANTLRLLKLPDGIRGHIISGQISMGHARALLAIEDHDIQKKVADRIIQNDLSVREIEDLVRKLKDEPTSYPAEISETSSPRPVMKSSTFGPVEEELKKRLKTKIQIKSSGNKGKILIHFHSLEELNRLIDWMMK